MATVTADERAWWLGLTAGILMEGLLNIVRAFQERALGKLV